MQSFAQEFKTLKNVIHKADSVLLFAHSRPDADTAGSVLALEEYIKNLGKKTFLVCFDPFPESLKNITQKKFQPPEKVNLSEIDLIIACDSVERGFKELFFDVKDKKVIALLDHHPDIKIRGDINIIDPTYSSVCEIIYDFFVSNNIVINREMATYILMGILGDTGIFQHSNTTPKVMEISSTLMKKGANLPKIISSTFSNKKITTLRLWGKAFEKARFNPKTGMIASVLTQKDLEECQATIEDTSQVAVILNTVPGTKFSLILSEIEDGIIKGSLRSEEYKGMDVSKIAAQFGGGGHKLASGFEVKGKIKETKNGWEIA